MARRASSYYYSKCPSGYMLGCHIEHVDLWAFEETGRCCPSRQYWVGGDGPGWWHVTSFAHRAGDVRQTCLRPRSPAASGGFVPPRCQCQMRAMHRLEDQACQAQSICLAYLDRGLVRHVLWAKSTWGNEAVACCQQQGCSSGSFTFQAHIPC